jgi:hypothetical protein
MPEPARSARQLAPLDDAVDEAIRDRLLAGAGGAEDQ